jgi:hypothetical protein
MEKAFHFWGDFGRDPGHLVDYSVMYTPFSALHVNFKYLYFRYNYGV